MCFYLVMDFESFVWKNECYWITQSILFHMESDIFNRTIVHICNRNTLEYYVIPHTKTVHVLHSSHAAFAIDTFCTPQFENRLKNSSWKVVFV